MRILLLCLACLATLGTCMGQEFKDSQTFEVDVSQLDRFHLYNRRGAVTVKAVNGNQARMQVTRRLKAKSNAKLETAKQDIYMDKITRGNEVVFYIKHPDLRLTFEDGNKYAWYDHRDKDGGWNWKNDDQVEVEFTVTLEIPAAIDLVVVNHEHPLKVSGMQGELVARNHHDGVLVEGQGGNADVHSHHGDVEVFYTKNPIRECQYDTHHGDIRVHYQNGLAADASLYSYHGEFFTEFDWTMQPLAVSDSGRAKGAKYKLSSKNGTQVKIGRGGPMQRFSTHHGDVFLLSK